MKKSDIGVIGLSVMGRNLALNIADHNYMVSIYNRTSTVTDEVIKNTPHKNFTPSYNLEDFVGSIEKPRKMILMVKAGAAVDSLIEQLVPLLDKEDIIIDGGNSFFKDTQRRYEFLKEKSIHFFGIGISGGEEGARTGPAIMPGGNEKVYRSRIQKILEDISAKANGNPCCDYTSTGGAGHYVKMVHNGIEYADMQLISEIYMILKHLGGFSNDELHNIFAEWNKRELESYLIQITSNIFKVKEDNGAYLLDSIMDKAGQKGTGKWMSLQAVDLGVNTSVITAALNSRYMSNLKQERIEAQALFHREKHHIVEDRKRLRDIAEKSLFLSKIVSYSQGFHLLKMAEEEYHWNFNYANIARIFRGGCIIQAKFLDNISEAYTKNPELKNLMFDDFFTDIINENQAALRELVISAVTNSIPATALGNALFYLDEYSTANGGTNLIQAQRDYFGAHTFERIDKDGSFHYDWVNNNE